VETLETDGTNGNITNRNSARMTPARFGSNSGFLICSFHRRMMETNTRSKMGETISDTEIAVSEQRGRSVKIVFRIQLNDFEKAL
jgi:hypothetical protein